MTVFDDTVISTQADQEGFVREEVAPVPVEHLHPAYAMAAAWRSGADKGSVGVDSGVGCIGIHRPPRLRVFRGDHACVLPGTEVPAPFVGDGVTETEWGGVHVTSSGMSITMGITTLRFMEGVLIMV